jgi:hypothetical protein
MAQRTMSRLREFHSPRVALEQLGTELVFQRSDVLAQRRLRDPQMFRARNFGCVRSQRSTLADAA